VAEKDCPGTGDTGLGRLLPPCPHPPTRVVPENRALALLVVFFVYLACYFFVSFLFFRSALSLLGCSLMCCARLVPRHM